MKKLRIYVTSEYALGPRAVLAGGYFTAEADAELMLRYLERTYPRECFVVA